MTFTLGMDLGVVMAKGVILGVPYGRKNGKLISKYMDILQKQDCAVLGAILIDADMRFQRRYYQDITKR